MTQDEFAKRLGISGKQLSLILSENASITVDIAYKLSKLIGTSAQIWLNLQNRYDTYQLYLKEQLETGNIDVLDCWEGVYKNKHDFVYKNKSKKTIKYLSWTCSFYNAVHDKVACDIRGYTSFTGKDTGPVEPGEEGGGIWECVIYDWAADYMKVESVSIIYMDGSTTSIGASDIKYLLNGPNYDQFIEDNGREAEVVERASQSLRKELRRTTAREASFLMVSLAQFLKPRH